MNTKDLVPLLLLLLLLLFLLLLYKGLKWSDMAFVCHVTQDRLPARGRKYLDLQIQEQPFQTRQSPLRMSQGSRLPRLAREQQWSPYGLQTTTFANWEWAGLSNLYRRFVRDFCRFTSALTALLRENARFNWATTRRGTQMTSKSSSTDFDKLPGPKEELAVANFKKGLSEASNQEVLGSCRA
ncbi:MAG: hypothetical protein J3Q66DRAFT_376131 [Benniella sp.]|nr:MAG: hypothetical protein J3Q66DRAFT_376131 [Benniella sp.]